MLKLIFEARVPIFLTMLIGTFSYGFQALTAFNALDPLVVALILGILTRTLTGARHYEKGAAAAIQLFIPFGMVFYALKNINFVRVSETPSNIVFLILLVMSAYFISILSLGKIFKQKPQISYLLATGSAICGASAIAITSPAVEAEPDDISISLLAVTLVALLGYFVLLPFLAILFKISGLKLGLLSGALVQFTGLVKAVVLQLPQRSGNLSPEALADFALSVKAARYLGLFPAIPLFASLIKRSAHLPWYLWLFLCAGILGTAIYRVDAGFYSQVLSARVRPVYELSWSMAMAAVGLNADVKQLLSDNGMKAFWMAMGGFGAALGIFFAGYSLLAGH